MGTKLGKQKWPSSFRSDVKLGQPTRLNDLSTITAWARLHTTAYLRLFRLTSGLVCPTFKYDYTHRVTLWKPFKIWQVGCRLDQHREGHLWSAPLRQELNWEGKGRSYTINAAHFYMAQNIPRWANAVIQPFNVNGLFTINSYEKHAEYKHAWSKTKEFATRTGSLLTLKLSTIQTEQVDIAPFPPLSCEL